MPTQHAQQREAGSPATAPTSPAGRQAARHVVYRGRWIMPVRLIVRAKVFQLLGGGSVGLLLGSLALQEASPGDIAALAGLALGMVGASASLWYYSRRYVGELSLLEPERQVLRLSVLDFWGNREDKDVHFSQLQPPLRGVRPGEINRLAAQLLFPINVPGERQFYVSISAGNILDAQTFMQLLKGEYEPPGQQAQQQQQQQQQQALGQAGDQQPRPPS